MVWGIGFILAAIIALACGVQLIVKVGFRKISISFGIAMLNLGLLLCSAGLVILIPAGVRGIEKLIFNIANFLLPATGAIVPYLFLIVSRHYGRASANESYRKISTFSKLGGQVALVILALVILRLVFITGYSEYGYTIIFNGFVGRVVGIVMGVLLIMALFNFENTWRVSAGGLKKQLFIMMALSSLLLAGLVRLFFLSRLSAHYYSFAAPLVVLCLIWLYFLLLRTDTFSSNIVVDRQAFLSSAVILFLGTFLVFTGIVAIIIERLGGRTDVFLSILGAFLVMGLFLLVLLSDSLRNRFSSMVQSRIYAGRFDYKAEWRELGEEFASSSSIDNLLEAINSKLNRLFGVDEAMIYIAERGKFVTAYPPGGNSLSFNINDPLAEWIFLKSEPALVKDIILTERGELTDLIWAHEIIVPIIAGKKLIGLILLGGKGDKTSYNTEDFALLTAISNQAAVTLLHLRSREKLLETEKLASFHKTASFVVHDLKNAVSMLSLMLQNAPNNMSNPEFQKESISTVSQAVVRMQKIIEKLKATPEKGQMQVFQLDPAKVLDSALQKSGVNNRRNIKINIQADTFDKVKTDPSVLETVLINLLINAVEAMPDGGEINIGQAKVNGHSEIIIADTGVGMSPAFMRNQLFKPFATTKSSGLGIGLYQCREMFTGTGGDILVDSEPGKGSKFRLVFP